MDESKMRQNLDLEKPNLEKKDIAHGTYGVEITFLNIRGGTEKIKNDNFFTVNFMFINILLN